MLQLRGLASWRRRIGRSGRRSPQLALTAALLFALAALAGAATLALATPADPHRDVPVVAALEVEGSGSVARTDGPFRFTHLASVRREACATAPTLERREAFRMPEFAPPLPALARWTLRHATTSSLS